MAPPLEISAQDYHADLVADTPTLSASMIHLLLAASPRHAWTAHPKLNPDWVRTEDAKFDVGTAVHSLLLEGLGNVHIVHADDWRTKDAQAQRDSARAAGMVPILLKKWDEVRAMAGTVIDALASFDVSPALLAEGKPERTLVWQEQGVWCRARCDWLRDDLTAIDDLKTTSRSANPEQWTRTTLHGIGADIQAAFYLRGLRAQASYELVSDFRWIIAETTPPYAVSVVEPGPDVLALADAKIDKAIRIWRDCLSSGVWPAYPLKVCRASLPPWEEVRWLEREAREEMAA